MEKLSDRATSIVLSAAASCIMTMEKNSCIEQGIKLTGKNPQRDYCIEQSKIFHSNSDRQFTKPGQLKSTRNTLDLAPSRASKIKKA